MDRSDYATQLARQCRAGFGNAGYEAFETYLVLAVCLHVSSAYAAQLARRPGLGFCKCFGIVGWEFQKD